MFMGMTDNQQVQLIYKLMMIGGGVVIAVWFITQLTQPQAAVSAVQPVQIGRW